MTVQTTTSKQEYTGNGVTTTFGFSFPFFVKDDIVVTQIDTSGVETQLVIGTNYSIPGVPFQWWNNGSSIVLTSPLPNQYKLVVERIVSPTQETSLRNLGRYDASAIEKEFDKLTMLCQQILTGQNGYLSLNKAGTEWQSRGLPFDSLISNTSVTGQSGSFTSLAVGASASIAAASISAASIGTLTSNLNAGSSRILNLPAPSDSREPLRKGDAIAQGAGPSFQYVDDKVLTDLFESSGYVYSGLWLPNIQIPAKINRPDGYALWEPSSGRILVPANDSAFITSDTIDEDLNKGNFVYSDLISKVDLLAKLAKTYNLNFMGVYALNRTFTFSSFSDCIWSDDEGQLVTPKSLGSFSSTGSWNADKVHFVKTETSNLDIYAENYDMVSSETHEVVNAALEQAELIDGAKVVTRSEVKQLSGTIQIPHGCILEGQGIPMTYDVDRDSTVYIYSGDGAAIQLGKDDDDNNRGCTARNTKVIGTDKAKGYGFRTIDTDKYPDTANTIKSELRQCTAEKLLVGFDFVNTWHYKSEMCVAVNCDTGFRQSGTQSGTGSGTTNSKSECLAYMCRIGFDLSADGWQYSSIKNAGSDHCQIGLRLGGGSNRGSSIENFGIEGVQPVSGGGFGIVVDFTGGGSYTLDGVHFGVMDNSEITYINILNSNALYFKNIDVPSSVLNSCTLLNWSSKALAGKLSFTDCSFFAPNDTQLDKLFSSNVTLINTTVQGRLYRHAIGGIDIFPQQITYTSTDASKSNNRLISNRIVAQDAPQRIFTGTPIFNATEMTSGDVIEIVNQSGNQMGFRSEEVLAGSGIVRDPNISHGTTIYVENNKTLRLQRRDDGKLYEIN